MTNGESKLYVFSALPIDNVIDRMYCEAIYDDYEGFRIFLKAENKANSFLKISFDSELAYRKIDEGDFLNTLNKEDLGKRKSIIYVSENSSFLEWFHQESSNIYKGRGIKDFLVVSSNDCIEVVAFDAPSWEWVDSIS